MRNKKSAVGAALFFTKILSFSDFGESISFRYKPFYSSPYHQQVSFNLYSNYRACEAAVSIWRYRQISKKLTYINIMIWIIMDWVWKIPCSVFFCPWTSSCHSWYRLSGDGERAVHMEHTILMYALSGWRASIKMWWCDAAHSENAFGRLQTNIILQM